MIAAAKFPFRPTVLLPKPTSNRPLCGGVAGFCLGFGPEQGAEQSKPFSLGRKIEVMEVIRKLSKGCFVDHRKKGLKLEIESVSGGEEVFDAASTEAKVGPEHLVVMVNGIGGSAADWRYAAEQFVKKLPDKVIVHSPISLWCSISGKKSPPNCTLDCWKVWEASFSHRP